MRINILIGAGKFYFNIAQTFYGANLKMAILKTFLFTNFNQN
jgi:hypothetical protein